MCDVLSKALTTGLTVSPIAAAANPKKIEKITICNISLVAIASKILLGTICSMKFSKDNVVVLAVTSEAAVKSTLERFNPTPGCKIFTKNIPNNNEMNEAVKNQPKAFPPILPTALISPSFAIPTTKVVNTKGEIIICTNRMKTVANILIFELNDCAISSEKLVCIAIPKIAPSTIATRICPVSPDNKDGFVVSFI